MLDEVFSLLFFQGLVFNGPMTLILLLQCFKLDGWDEEFFLTYR